MIIYYDILMIDDESLLNQRQSTRRRRLENIITCQKGYAEIVKNQVIACRKRTAAAELREVFARCITNREEGVVLKPDTPYFDFTTKQEPYACCSIKLKKEYIQGWGDVGDFAVIGARYDAAQAKAYKIPNLKWTHFYIGCLNNRNQVKAGNELARFTVVNIVEINETLMRTFLTQYSPETMPFDEQEVFDLELHGVALNKPPAVVFVNPVIFDVRCFSFDKEPNSAGWSMRFPMVSKIHFDRSYIDAITYDELQEAAKAAVEMPPQEDSQELRAWIAALEKADPRGIAVDAVSQYTTSTESTESSSVAGSQVSRSRRNGVVQGEPGVMKQAAACKSYAQGPPGLPTPETSAVGQELASNPSSEAIVAGRKRPKTSNGSYDGDDEPASKRRRPRRSTEAESSMNIRERDRQRDRERDAAHLAIQGRQPLRQIDQNIAMNERGLRNTTSSTASTASTTSASSMDKLKASNDLTRERAPALPPQFNGDPTVPSSGQSDGAMSRTREQSQQTASSLPPEPNVATCPHAGHKCALAKWSFLVSPYITTYAWVTESLLKDHGITNYIVDPSKWTKGKGNTRRARKICLVESKNKGATEAFLKKVEEANLQTRSGKREWIAVYDWRVLEKVTELESLGSGMGNYDPWRQFYIGIA